jgi:hypothetical protein
MHRLFKVGWLVLLLVVLTSARAQNSASRYPNYVGDKVCGECHQKQSQSFHQTAHFLTSRLPDRSSILGSFDSGENILKTSNPDLFFRMEAKNGEFFQTAVEGAPPYAISHSEKFGIVVGSGGKGQTYLYWKGNQLFQLPVSYWTEVGWVNSPGYRDGTANFDRPVVPRCLDCHGTYFASQATGSNQYENSGYVVGITCEKCHGSGVKHVERERSKSSSVVDTAILNPTRFSRERQMDLCAWCHAGRGAEILPSFSYVPGQALDKYIDLPQPGPEADIDVHGSQVELLKKSRCYQSSSMTCLTCHDVHETQHDPATFSAHCLSCHRPQGTMFPKDHDANRNCADCHMPKQKTALIVFDWNGKRVTPEVRTHWIKVYAQEQKR